jgi:uncharacterized protein
MEHIDTILSNTLSNKLLLVAYGILIISLLGAWLIKNKNYLIIGGILALTLAVKEEHAAPIAALPLLLLYIAATASQYDHNKIRRSIWRISLVILPLVTGLGFSGAFCNWTLLDDIQLGNSSSNYALKANMSKPLIALILLATVVPTINRLADIKRILIKTIPILLIGIPVVAIFSLIVGYTRFDFKLQPIIFVWGIVNLFITCMGEEVFFRGIILRELMNTFISFRNGKLISLVLSSLIFGVVHFDGGLLFILVATIAGLLYGIAYIKTENIESSILCHFGLNVFHFVFLTYPKI